HGQHARRKFGHLGTGTVDGFFHLAQDVHTAFVSLGQCNLHDFLGDALDLDIHLQGSDTFLGTGNLEVHIAQVIFVTQNVGQHSKLVAFLSQNHGQNGHVILHRHTSVHNGQRATEHGCHGGGTVGLSDLGHHTDGVLEIFSGRQQRSQSTLGQTTVTDFTTLWSAETAGFASSERRHVVVHHEAIAVLAHDRVNDLLVLLGTQGGHYQSLSFATCEQGATVSTGQNAQTNADRTNGAGIATVNTGFAAQDARTHNLAFQVEHHVFNGNHIRLILTGSFSLSLDRFFNLSVDSTHLFGTSLFFASLVGLSQTFLSSGGYRSQQAFVNSGRLPVPLGLAGFFNQFVNAVDGRLHLLVSKHHTTQHDFFGQLLGFGLNHQHCLFGTGHNQIQSRRFQLSSGWVQYVLTINVTHANSAHRTIERNAGDSQSSRSADHGSDIRINF